MPKANLVHDVERETASEDSYVLGRAPIGFAGPGVPCAVVCEELAECANTLEHDFLH